MHMHTLTHIHRQGWPRNWGAQCPVQNENVRPVQKPGKKESFFLFFYSLYWPKKGYFYLLFNVWLFGSLGYRDTFGLLGAHRPSQISLALPRNPHPSCLVPRAPPGMEGGAIAGLWSRWLRTCPLKALGGRTAC